MSILTTFFNLIKPAKTDRLAVSDFNANMDIIDTEMHKPPLTVNEIAPDPTTRNIAINEVPRAGNLSSDIAQLVTGTFVQRASGGGASIDDGYGALVSLRGNMVHTGYVPEVIDMTVTPATRTAPPAITATLDNATFEAYVETAGTYTLTYTTAWSADPTLYGVTVSNTPVNGDEIVIVWNGTDDPEMSVNAAERHAPPAITAILDRNTFVAYVSTSGTVTLTYTTAWSANPALYGITVQNTPISGDVITVDYTKEDRGTITTATPTSFNSTGWNLYDNTAGYAKVVKYSDSYGYKLGGTYTLVEFAATLTGTRAAVTITNGYFTVPSDGYVFITGGDSTTYVYATWSDWTSSYEGDFNTYTVDTIDLSEIMVQFPYGLLAVGTVRDEINFNTMTAINRVQRLAYTTENIAAVIASGVAYEADRNYIYAVLETPVTASITESPTYTVNDHGIEFFDGTTIGVLTETLYGENLKDKLRTDVLTISQQTLDSTQKAQVQSNLGLVPTQQRNISAAGYVADARVINAINGQIASREWTPTGGDDTILNYVTSIDRSYLPVSFVKKGTVTPSDCPFATDEFTGLVVGNGDRMKVTIKPYKSTNNNIEYSRDVWQNTWLESGWDTLNTWRPYQVKRYTYSCPSIAAGGYKEIKASDAGLSTPDGYAPVAFAQFSSGTTLYDISYANATASGTDVLLTVANNSSSTVAARTIYIGILYMHV